MRKRKHTHTHPTHKHTSKGTISSNETGYETTMYKTEKSRAALGRVGKMSETPNYSVVTKKEKERPTGERLQNQASTHCF